MMPQTQAGKRAQYGAFVIEAAAYAGDAMRAKVVEKGFLPVVPPKRNRKLPWAYDKERYKRRNEIERYFLRLKHFRRIITH